MAIVKRYPARIVKIFNNCQGVYTLELMSLEKPFKYNAGQFLHLAIDEYDPSGRWPDSRCFSIQSAPGSEIIKITYSVIGEFTSLMEKQLKIGSEVTLKLPYGELFTQSHNKLNTFFISGGTGITPFLSLFNDQSFKEYVKPVLFAGFRNRDMNFYDKELNLAKSYNPDFEINAFYEDVDGYINAKLILSRSQRGTSFFISGPPVMIQTFKNYLLKNGVSVKQIHTDEWM